MSDDRPGTLAEAFRILLRRIELNPTRVEQISVRYGAMKEYIEGQILGARVTQVGSFQRKTKIRPQDNSDKIDLDVLIRLGQFDHFVPSGGITVQDALTKVDSALRSSLRYSKMESGSNEPVIFTQYSDGEFSFELIPAYADNTPDKPRPGEPPCYWVGDGMGRWKRADYDYDAMVVSACNQACNGELVPSIKLVKRFLRNRQIPLKSYHIEVLCMNALFMHLQDWVTTGKRWGYQHALAAFLASADGLMVQRVQLTNSATPGLYVGDEGHDPNHLRNVLYNLGQEAWRLCDLPDSRSTIEAWREFYGGPFPAP